MINVTPGAGRGTGGGGGGVKEASNLFRTLSRPSLTTKYARKGVAGGVKATTTAAKVLKAGGNIPKVAKNLDPFLGMTKGAVNMAKLMPGGSALKNSLGPLFQGVARTTNNPVSDTHLRAHETLRYLVCRLLLETKVQDCSSMHFHLASV